MLTRSVPAPTARRYTLSEQEHLHHRAGRENLNDGAGRRFDFCGRLSNLDPGDSLDLLPQFLGRAGEQLPMKLLYLSGTLWILGQGLLGWRQRPVQRDQQRVPAENHGHQLGVMARSLLLESNCRLGNLLRHARIEFFHCMPSRQRLLVSCTAENKKADVAENPEVFNHVGLLFNEPPGTSGLLSI